MKYLLAHNLKNLVKVGDKLEKYKTPVGTIGTGDGAWYAHLHCSAYEQLSNAEVKGYINSWSTDKIEKYYHDPTTLIDFQKMFKQPVDVGNRGYGWLSKISGGAFHPGVDINGLGGGNTDLDYEFTSPCDGIVVASENWGSGWGKILIIEETKMSEKNYYIKSDLRNQLKKLDDKFDHEKPSHHDSMAEKVGSLLDQKNALVEELRQSNIKIGQMSVNFDKDIQAKNAVIEKQVSELDKLKDGNTWVWFEGKFAISEKINLTEIPKISNIEEPKTLGYYLMKCWEIISPLKK